MKKLFSFMTFKLIFIIIIFPVLLQGRLTKNYIMLAGYISVEEMLGAGIIAKYGGDLIVALELQHFSKLALQPAFYKVIAYM